jgi:hypothetical protein
MAFATITAMTTWHFDWLLLLKTVRHRLPKEKDVYFQSTLK